MDLRHCVATTRQVDVVRVPGVQDQFWYRHDGNSSADIATPYFSCGQYIDNNGEPDKPYFFDFRPEVDDYRAITPGALPPAHGGSQTMFSNMFYELERERKDLLIFMFGYHNPFVKEFNHVKHLHRHYIEDGNANLGRLLMLTWPSQGFGQYRRELGSIYFGGKNEAGIETDVAITGRALAVFLLKMYHFMHQRYAHAPAGTYVPKLNFIVQSMANHVWGYAAAALADQGHGHTLNGFFSNLMLTSPDIRNDIFQYRPVYAHATSFARRAFLVFSKQDFILKLSDRFHSIPGTSRLGLAGPISDYYVPGNTHIAEVHQHRIGFKPIDYNHRYFEYNREVRDLYAGAFTGGRFDRRFIINARTDLPRL